MSLKIMPLSVRFFSGDLEKNLETELLLVKEDVRVEKKKTRRLNNYIEHIEFYADELEEYIDSVDVKLDKLNQYSRRENLQILNIPPTVSNKKAPLSQLSNAWTSICILLIYTLLINSLKRKASLLAVSLDSRTDKLKSIACVAKNLRDSAAILEFKRDPVIIETLCPSFQAI